MAVTAAQLNGTWTLRITDFRATAPPTPPATPDQLFNWTLNLTSGLTDSPDSQVASTNVVGSQSGTFPRASAAAGPQGIGPGIQIASDNTLGSFSPHQGRLYVAYVNYVNFKNGPGAGIDNPADNTDIFLAYSDNGGQSWVSAGQVNDDRAVADGYTGAQPFPSGNTLQVGRPQFMPNVAVDQATGTLVMSWKDVRDDAARSRSAVYVTASSDGGATFNQQVYANQSKTATDAITLQDVTLSPEPDNTAGLSPASTLGFGSGEGLAVYGGHIYPVWAANFNRAFIDANNAVQGFPLHVVTRPMLVAAGPRILSSTMGPVAGLKATSFQVTFDRAIDPSTFTKADVQVYYHDTVNGDAFIPLLVNDPVNQGGNTFSVTFDPDHKPDGTASGITHYTGTYSYFIRPEITDLIRTVGQPGNLMDQNANGVGGQDPLITAVHRPDPGRHLCGADA